MASNLWLAVGSGGTGKSIVTSSDGNTWTSTGSTVIAPNAVAYKNNLWVAVGGGGNTIAISTDGVLWTGRGSTIFSGGYGYSVAFGNNLWVAAGSTSPTVYSIATSTDGITWTSRTCAIGSAFGVAYGKDGSGNGLWVAVGTHPSLPNTIATSANGITWTLRSGFGYRSGFGVAYGRDGSGNGLWVAVGGIQVLGEHAIMTSTDGITWMGRNSTILNTGNGVAYGQDELGNKLWVAVGRALYTQSIATSYDGITWTGRTGATGVTGQGKSVTYANGLWVATFEGANSIATSTNGINWTVKNNPLINGAYGVVGPTKATLLTNYYLPTKKMGDASFNIIPPTSNNYGAITYTSSNTAVATIVGSKINVVGVGTSTITAVQEETFSYLSGTNTATFQVIQSTVGTETVLTDFSVPTKIIGDASFDLVAPTTNSDGSFVYTSSNTAVATIVGSTVTIVGVGTSTISAIQLMTSDYATATVTAPFVVNQITSVLTNFSVPTKTFGDVSFGIVAPTTNGNGAFSYASSDTTVATISGDRITVVGGGSSTITATQASTTNYTSATITAPLTVNQATTVLSNFVIGPKTIADASFGIVAPTTNSTGVFTYTSSDPTVATIVGNVATIVGIGSATITANQASNANYLAQTISTTLQVSNNLWVAVGQGGNTVASSSDGILWKGLGTTGFSNLANSIAYSNNLWVAVGNGIHTLAYSTTNGNTWTGFGSTIFSTRGYRILYDSDAALWIAIGQGGNSIATSTTPKTSWTGQGLVFPSATCIYGPATNYSGAQNLSAYLLGGYSTGSLLAYSLDGTTWQMGTTSGLACQGFNTIAYGNGIYVAGGTPTGTGNSFATSTDQISWTGRGGSTNMTNVNQITYGNGIFIAVGTKGTAGSTIMKSTDGITWTNLTNVYGSYSGRCVAYYQGRWIVGGAAYYGINYSDDNGTTWTNSSSSYSIYSTQTNAIAYGNNIVVSVGQGTGNTLAISTDFGVSWTGKGLLLSGSGNDVKYIDGLWLAVGGDNVSTGNIIIKSTDNGTTWTQVAIYNTSYFTSVSNVQNVNGTWYISGRGAYYLAYSNTSNPTSISDFVMVSTVSFTTNGASLLTFNYQKPKYIVGGKGMKGSVTGLSWFDILNQPFTTVNDVYWNGTIWVGVGECLMPVIYGWSSTVRNTIAYSYDGINWVGIGATIFTTSGNNVYYSTTNSLWIATGTGTNTIATSVDGITWTGRGTNVFTTAGGKITYYNNLLIGVGEGTSKFATSTNGISWDTNTRITTGRTVAYINNQWIVAGDGATFATSSDGMIWRDLKPTVTNGLNNCYSIAYGNGKWVAVGTDGSYYGKIMYSTDGINWTGTASNAGMNGYVYKVVYGQDGSGNGLWVAAGSGGNSIATSTDGITWTGRASIFGTARGVAYGNGLWVAVGQGTNAMGANSIATSTNGITWTIRNSNAFGNGYGVAYGNGLWVAVGANGGGTATSTDGITWTARSSYGYYDVGYNVAYGNGLWVSVCTTLNYTSPDGITWTARAHKLTSGYDVAYSNGLWVTCGYAGSNTTLFSTSTDGITWTLRNENVFTSKGFDVVGPANTVTKITTVLSNFSVPVKTFGDASFSLVAPTTNSDGVITYTSSNPAVATIDGSTITIVRTGSTTITAYQANTSNYSMGTITATFTVNKITTVLSNFAVPEKTFGDASFSLVAPTTNSDGAITYTSSNAAVATIVGNVLTIVGGGTATITATQATTPIYADQAITASFLVNQKTTVLSNFSVITKTFGDASFNLVAPTTNSTGSFTYTSSNTAVATIIGTTVTIVGTGTATITATQASNTNFLAQTITATITVIQAIPTITKLDIPAKIIGTAPFALVAPVTNSTGAFTYTTSDESVATINGNMVTIVGLGITTITAIQASTANYTSGTISAPLAVVTKIPLSIATGQGGNSIATSTDLGFTWTGRGTTLSSGYGVAGPATYDISTAYANFWITGGYSSSGSGNTFALSTDGITLTGVGLIQNTINGFACANNLLVAVSGGGGPNKIAYSTNGITWNNGVGDIFTGQGYSVAYGAGLWVAAGTNYSQVGNTIATSTNGINWVGRGSPVSYSGRGVAFGKDGSNNNLWVVVGAEGSGNRIASSPDGITWTVRSADYAIFYTSNGVAFGKDGSGNNLWVAVGTGNAIATSINGTNWVGRGTSVFTTQGWCVAYGQNGSGAGLWVAVGEGGNSIATSTDGLNWTGRGTTIFTNFGRGVAYANNQWFAVGNGGNYYATSVDGINWTGRSGSTVFGTSSSVYCVAYAQLEYAKPTYVAVGTGTNTIVGSTNGTTWSSPYPSPFTTTGTGVAWNGMQWVAFGSGGNNIAYSADGIRWTGNNSTITTQVNGLAYGKDGSGNGLWVSGGYGGNSIATSTDGIVWTGRGATSMINPWGIAYGKDGSGNGLWVAVGGWVTVGGNTIATSTNGIIWTGRGATVFTSIGYAVSYANNLWVAVGVGGNTIATSRNGTTWTGLGLIMFTQGNGIRYTNNLWVATGQGGNTMATSVDGTNWVGRGSTLFTTAGQGLIGPTAVEPMLSFSVPIKNIGDAPFTITPPTSNSTGSFTYTSSNLAVATIAGNVVTIVGMGTSVITAVQASTDFFISGTIVTNLVVENVKPTISNFVVSAKTFGDAVFTLIPPTSQSSGAFTYTSSNTAVATIAGNVVTIVGGGTATITANQANTANYGSTAITASLVVTQATPVLTNFDIPIKTFGNAAFTITAPTTNSTGGITYTSSNTAVATIVGSTITIVGAGNAIITATQASTASFVSGTITATFVVSKITPTISSFSVPAKTIGNADFSLVAPTSNSTGAFTYTSSNTAVATITNNTVMIVGSGTSTITATQSTSTNYTSGTITATFTVNSPVWVMVGSSGNSIATSTDAITWTGRGSAVFSTLAYGVAYGNDLYVAVGQGTNTIASSTDGVTWIGRGATVFTTYGYGVAFGKDSFGNNLWVATGYGGNAFASSTDGITWTGRGSAGFGYGSGVTYANGLWVAVGGGGNTIATSTNGTTWTGRGQNVMDSSIYSVTYGNGLWVATGRGGGNSIATSVDGITWTGLGTSVFNTYGYGVAYGKDGSGNGLWVATGSGGNTIATSTNGTVWTGRGSTVFTSQGSRVVYSKGLWVAVGNGGNNIATSTNGITWTGRGATIFTTGGNDIVAPPKIVPKISNFSISPKAVGSAAFAITAPTTNSDGTFTYTSSNTSVATVTGNTITIIGMGSTTITATQAVSDSYLSGTITTVFQVYGVGTYTQDNVNYTYYNGLGTAEVTGGTTAARELSSLTVLPSFVVGGTTYTVTGVGYMAFNNWSNLTSISLPPSITTMAFSCFRGTSFTSFTIPPLVTTLDEFVLSIPTLTSITIPSTVTAFKYIFDGRSSTGPFVGCTSLVNIVVNTYISGFQYVFYKVNNPNMSVTFNYPGTIPPNCLESQTNLKTVIIGNDITSIGGTAFGSCTGLSNVTIGSSVTTIGNSAFLSCTGLTNITIPLSVTTIGDSVFANCTNLNNVTIPLSVTTIGFNTFENCTSFTNMTIPASVTSVGWYIFKNCTNLTNIIVKAYLGALSYTFNNVNSLNMSVTFDYAAFVPAYLFTNVTNLKTVILSNSITGIEGYAFSGCTGLTEITIPASVTTIANFAFLGCSNLNLVTFFGNIPTIGTNNFTASSTDTAFYKVDGTTNTNATTVAAALTMFANKAVIGAGSPTMTNFSIPMKRYNDLSFSIVDPSSNSSGAFSYSSSNSFVATVSGKTITIVAPGSTIITATQSASYKNGVNYTSGTITTTFVVDNPPPQVGPLLITNKSLGDVSFSMVDPTKPNNSTGTWTYASSDVTKATVSGNVVTLLQSGIVTITGTISSDSNYCSTKVTGRFSISPADVIPSTFVFVSTTDVSNAIPVTVQPVANTVVLSPTIFTPEKIELFNPSTGTVEEKVENRNSLVNTFFDLYSTVNTITIPQTAFYMPPTIDLANITEVKLLKTSGSTAQSPVVINSSAFNLTTAFFCAIDEVGNSVLFNGTSTFVGYSVKISKVSDNNYTIVQTKQGVSTTFSAIKDDIIYYAGFKLVIGSIAGQLSTLQLVTLSNFSVPVKTLADISFSLVPPTTTSNGLITYTSSDSSVATVAGDVVTVVGLGTSTITAVQARTNAYLSDTITTTLTVNKISTVLTNFSVPTKIIGDASFSLIPPTSNSDGTFTYTSSDVSVATIVGNVVTIVGTGTSTITVSQATTARYTAGTTTATFTVNKVTTVLTNFSIPVKTFGNAAFAITAPTTNSNGSITYTSSNTAVATVTGSTITIVGGGSSTITATQATTSIYASATTTATLQVNQVTTVLSNFSIPTKTYGNAAFTITAPTTNSNGSITYTSSDTTVATVAGNVITIVGGGVSTITANQASTNNYTSGTITATLTVNKLTTTLSNFSVPTNRLVGDIFTAVVPTSNRSGAFTYTSSNLAVATIDGSTITVVGGGETIITVTQATTSIYATGTISATLKINQITTVLSNFLVPAKKVGDATFTITPPTTNGNGAFTYTSSNTSVATIVGNTITTVGVGNTTITASQASTAYSTAGSITTTLQVTQGTLTLSNFSVPTKTILDLSFSITPPTTKSIGLITYTSSNTSVATIVGNTVTIVGLGSTTITASQATTVNYTSATISTVFQVIKATPTLSDFSIPDKTIGSSTFIIPPFITDSDGALTYTSSNTAVATIAGNRITIKGVGTATITASQATTAIYTSATITTQFQVNLITTVLTNFVIPAKTFGDIPFKVQASSNSSGAITYTSSDTSVATIVGDIVTIVGAGSSTITASQDVWNNYDSATTTLVMQVNQITTVLSNFVVPVKTVGNAAFAISPPSTNSNGAFTYTSSNTAVATIDGNMVTIVGAGSSIITANQASTTNYTSETITATIQVSQAIPVLTNFAVPTKSFGSPAFNLVTPSTNSDGAFTYTSSNALVATVAGNVITIVGTGNVIITATQSSTTNYISGIITAPFVVTKSSLTITNFSVSEKSFGSAAFTVTPPTTNGVGIFTYTSSNTEVATIAKDVITIVGIGSTTITATQASTANFISGTISATFTVSKGTPSLTNFSVPAKTIGDATFTVTPPSSNGDGLITYTSSDLSVATIDGSTITIVGAGSSTITANQASTTNFLSGTTLALLTVNRITTLLNTFSVPAKTFGDAPFALVPPNSNREGAFTYTSSNTAVATIDGDTVTIVGGGNTTITAVQTSTANYKSGTISTLFQVNTMKTVLTNFVVPAKIIGDNNFTLDPPTTNSDGAFTYTSSNQAVATIVGNVVTILALGNTTITAVQTSTANYTTDTITTLFQVKLIRTVLSNFVVPAKTVGDVGFTLVPPTTNSDGNFTYTSSNLLVATVAGNVVTVVGTGNVTITAIQESTFNSTPAQITASLVVNKATNAISWFSVPEKLFGNAPFTIVPPTTNSNGLITYTSSNLEVATISKNVVTIVGIGNTTITAVQANTVNYSSGTISATFIVSEGTPGLANFSVPAKIVGDATFTIIPPTTKSNGAITYTSSNTAVATIAGDVITVVGVGTSTITANQASTASFISGTITSTLQVNKITTVLTNFVVPVKTFGDSTFTLTPPTTNSNGLITYTSSNPAVATIDGDIVTIVGGGNATITAEQASTSSYLAATITGLLQVNKVRTVLTNFSVPAKKFGEAAFALVPPTTSSDGAFTYTSSNPEVVTIDGDIVTIVGLGSAAITAAQASTSNYTSDTIRALFQVNLITSVLTNFVVPSKKVGDATFTISPPTSNTDGAFTYTSSNALVATVVGDVITVIGVGTSTITAVQASTQNSTSAIITAPFVVTKSSPVITNFSIPVKAFGNAAFNLVPPTTNSNGVFTYTSSNPEVATISKNVVTIVGIGTSTITASQASTASHISGSITALLQVNQGTAVLTNFSVPSKTFGSATFSLVSPSSNSDGTFTYTSSNTDVATINGNIVTIIGAGSSTITANQASTTNYLSGTMTATFAVNPITTILTDFSVPSKAVGNPTFSLVPPTTNSDGAFTYTSSVLSVATIDGDVVTIVGGGISTITATQASTTNYTSKTITALFQVSALTTVLSNFNMPTKAVGNAAFAIEPPTTNGDGAFTYTSSNTRIATIAGNMVTIVGAGTATIRAVQSSTPNYSSATITALFIVNKGTAAITNFIMPIKEIGMADFTIRDPSSNSIGEFTYTSSNIKVATIFKNIVSIKGIGNSIITATQAMSADYIPGTTTTTFVVNQMSPTITGFTIPATKLVGDKAFKITAAKSNSISPFTYTSSNTAVATIAKDSVTIVGAGTTVITGTQPATKSYGPGTVTATLTVNSKTTVLSNFSISKKIIGIAPFALIPPTTNSNGVFTYTSSNTAVATITGNMVVLVGVGTTTITANQASTSNFTSETISTPLVVNLPTPQVGTLVIPNKSVTNPLFSIVNPTKPENNSGTWTYTSSDLTKATISGNEVTLLQPGIVTIAAALSSDSLYNSRTLMTQFSVSDQNVAPSSFVFIQSAEVEAAIPATVMALLNTVIPATVSTPANNLKFNPILGTVAEKQANHNMIVNTLCNMFSLAFTISVPTPLLYVPLAFNKTKLKTIKLVRPTGTTGDNPLVINTITSDSTVAFLCSIVEIGNGVQINGVGTFAGSFIKIAKGIDNKYLVTRSTKGVATTAISLNGDIISFVGITAMIGY